MAGSRSSCASIRNRSPVDHRLRRTTGEKTETGVLGAGRVRSVGNPSGVSVGSETSRAGMGVSSMSEAQSGSLLVEYFKDFLD